VDEAWFHGKRRGIGWLDRDIARLADRLDLCFTQSMELSESHPWRMANLLVLVFVLSCGIVSLTPSRSLWLGFISDRVVQLSLSVASGIAIHNITKRFVAAIRDYEPKTQIQAKRANEQIKLSASFGNMSCCRSHGHEVRLHALASRSPWG